MKTIRIPNGVIWAFFLVVSCVRAGQPDSDQIARMTEAVRNSTLEQFVQLVGSNKLEAPVIFSSWHVENVATNDPSPAKLAALGFGRELAVRLDQWSGELTASTQTADAARMAGRFIDLAQWLENSPGYGNLIISSGCRGTSLTGVGRMLVDTNWPMESTEALIKRLAGYEVTSSDRMKVLNAEAGAPLFDPIQLNESANQATLEKTWQIGALAMFKNSPNMRAIVASGRPLPLDLELVRKELEPKITPLISRHHAFFSEDLLPASTMTMVDQLNIKWHKRFVYAGATNLPAGIQALADFRRAVGYFPDDYTFTPDELKQKANELKAREALREREKARGRAVVFAKEEEDLQVIAFDRAWKSKAENGGPAQLALNTYLSIKSHMPQATNDPNPRVRMEAWKSLVENGNIEGMFVLTESLPKLDKPAKESVLNCITMAAIKFRMEFNRSKAAWTNNEVLAEEWSAWWQANKHRYGSERQ